MKTKTIKTEKYGDAIPSSPGELVKISTAIRSAADKIESQLQPPARAEAVARTLREVAALVADETWLIHHLGLAAAFGMLGSVVEFRPKHGYDADPEVIARRKTCDEIAAALRTPTMGTAFDPVPLRQWVRVLDIVHRSWADSPDQRRAAIAATAAREAAELRLFAPDKH